MAESEASIEPVHIPTPPVGWGFIGAGGVARRQMLPAVAGEPGVKLAAVMVRELSRARTIADEFGAASAYESVPALLNDPAVEAVYIATPPVVHEAQVLAAVERGKAVLLEKPMAIEPGAARRMRQAADSAGVLLAVCFPLRHTAAVQTMRSRIRSGELGELVLLRGQMVKWYPLDRSLWRADPERAGGGVLMDLGSHLLDWVYYLGGEARHLSAAVGRRVWDVDVEDTALVQLGLAGGAMATIELGFGIHGGRQSLEAYGTKGAAVYRDGRLWIESERGVEEPDCPGRNVYREELLDFSRALREGHAPATCGGDGERNVAQLAAAYESADQGRRMVVASGW